MALRLPTMLALCGLAGCDATQTPTRSAIPMDPHSHCDPNRVRVTHAGLDLAIDMAERALRGSVVLDFDRLDRDAPLVVDVEDLAIESVAGADGKPRPFTLGVADPRLGSALSIDLAPGDASVRIEYRTTERSSALQWLAPEQTTDKQRPFLFTQGQSVLTRTWIPVQDSPGVRITYDARIRAPQGLTVVMSAEQLGQDAEGAWRFRMGERIPSYLIALAVGVIEFRAISERCGVWAEPSVVERARAELEDTEAMIASAEALFGPYRWGRYDLIVLPAAFPFGGMENPRLTFATPTILAGDKSLVSLVAHELAHSWSGNLVTNATWRDFWLNEGFTVYFENRIMERVFGAERARMERELAIADLEREMKDLAARDQVLHIDLEGRHPDDGFSGVPYTKGALFLSRLEEIFGRERFDRFLTSWFDGHAFESVTTERFLSFLKQNLLAADPTRAARIDIAAWMIEPGLPADAPRPRSQALTAVDREIARWKEGAQPAQLVTRGWVTQQWLHFLEGLADALDPSKMAGLDLTFGFTQTGNSEVLDVWLRLAIRHGYAAADARLEQFLVSVGRRKFLEPLYKELAKTPAGLARARSIYAEARPRYHAVSSGTIDAIVKWGS